MSRDIKVSHYQPSVKAFTIGDRHLVFDKSQRKLSEGSNTGYDGPPAEVKEVDLADEQEDPKPVFIATDLSHLEEQEVLTLLREFRDCFAWTYKDMQGVPLEVCEHTIPMKPDAKPVHQRPYPMNPKYASQIQEEINKLIECGFIYEIEHPRLGYRPSWWSLRRMENLGSALISRK